MDFEQARFNMVEQQIRTWDVLDQDVLDLLFEVRREDFVPPRLSRARVRRPGNPARRRRADVDAQDGSARAAGARARAATSRCWRSAPAAAISDRAARVDCCAEVTSVEIHARACRRGAGQARTRRHRATSASRSATARAAGATRTIRRNRAHRLDAGAARFVAASSSSPAADCSPSSATRRR